MKHLLLLLLIVLVSCTNQPNKEIELPSKNTLPQESELEVKECADYQALKTEIGGNDLYEIQVPEAWSIISQDTLQRENLVFGSEAAMSVGEDFTLQQLSTIGVYHYCSNQESLKKEHEGAISYFNEQSPNTKIIAQGYTQEFGDSTAYMSYSDSSYQGKFLSYSFLKPSISTRGCYYILSAEVVGYKNIDSALCPVLNCLKTFEEK